MRWENIPERGSILGIKIVLWTLVHLGYKLGTFLVSFIVIWQTIFNIRARKASYQYLENLDILKRNSPLITKWIWAYKHQLSFAINMLDRVWFWSGKWEEFEITRTGHSVMEDLKKTGGIIVGAHIGSFDLLRAFSDKVDFPINVVMYTGASEKFHSILKGINPNSNLNIINLANKRMEAIFELQTKIEKGELVAILGDRNTPGSMKERVTEVEFLGKMAPMPQHVWILANTFKCPIVFASGIRTGIKSYEMTAVKLFDQIKINRKNRQEDLREIQQAYVDTLANICKKHPLQWFNFYNFWK